MPVWIGNDGSVAVIGEAMLGAAKHVEIRDVISLLESV